MLFNSYAFLLGFFPVTLIGFFLIARMSHAAAALWLAIMSLVFYGYWSVAALPLLLGSVCINYAFGIWVTPSGDSALKARRLRLTLAVIVNLSVLGYFKYANFFIDNLNHALVTISRAPFPAADIVLPIGISFFTFTQLAFLVDCYEGKVRERFFTHYLLFVSYFPHLISGPVLHHSQMMPQFRRPETYRLRAVNISTGLLGIAIGIAKKVLLADEFSQYASPVFDAARDGHELGLIAAWTGALAYTLQIYFDFSGYSDMALGLSRMLGIELPLNFDAPYKAESIIDFWRRWHMTLSNFLRDYLYFRLGGNRRGAARRYANLLITMVLGGLWHGASWTFVAWGALHGVYLLINHAFRALRAKSAAKPNGIVGRIAGAAVTFLAVVVAWVFFRATTFSGALRVLRGMANLGHESSGFASIATPPVSFTYSLAFFALGFALIWLCPTSQALVARFERTDRRRAALGAGALAFSVLLCAVINSSHHNSEFIYFNF
jgi:alginate O-acetyltransferase complex protein AlgI